MSGHRDIGICCLQAATGMLLAFLLVLSPQPAAGAGNAWGAGQFDAVLHVPADIAAVRGALERIYLHSVKDGRAQTAVLGARDLAPNVRVPVAGYVTGLVIRGSAQLTPWIDGVQMDAVRSNADGTVYVRNFGFWAPGPLAPGAEGSEFWAGEGVGRGRDSGLYSLFPAVAGAPLCSTGSSDIVLQAGSATVRLSLVNPGYTDLGPQPAGVRQRVPVVFRYLGSRPEVLRGRPADLQARIDTVLAGIAAVEAALDAALVERVTIIDYEAIHDAVTVRDQGDIWFYIPSFSGESLPELRSMAEHEAIHLYVDRVRLTRNSRLRELFADLKGYDGWSQERFELLTRGRVSPSAGSEGPAANPFFAFIDERNFQEGRRGGHAHDDLDEFCTSFIHSLMFAERIGANLHKPLQHAGVLPTGVRLTAGEREMILATYGRLLDIIREHAAGHQAGKTAVRPGQALFLQAQRHLKTVG